MPDIGACSTETSKELCRDLGADPETWWGIVNNYILDGYHEGVRDERERTRDAERAAARLAVQVGALRGRVAELEALLDVDPCADCGAESCENCIETESDPAKRAALRREAAEIARDRNVPRSDRIRSARLREVMR
jgi:hypothetical protein